MSTGDTGQSEGRGSCVPFGVYLSKTNHAFIRSAISNTNS
jgi:hypothetical protein